MFKLTVYKKVNLSRNFFSLLLIACLILTAGKMVLAYEKITTYKEAVRLYQAGELVEAEKKFRAARLNFSVKDHDEDIKRKLGILSPIREMMEDLDEKAREYQEKNDLIQLVETYSRWQENRKKWVSGTAVQRDMYEEMNAVTKLEKDMQTYFSSIKKKQFSKLTNNTVTGEKGVFDALTIIPAEYFGGEAAKTKEIQASFESYYAARINKLTSGNAAVVDTVDEGKRQFRMLSDFSMDAGWLKDVLDSFLLKVLTAAYDKKDYAAFADQANTTNRLSFDMADAKVFPYIEKTKKDLLTKAKGLAAENKYADAISIYEALKPLEDTAELIADVNHAWDQSEPIRVLKRLYPDKEFPNYVYTRSKWGADSAVAAVSKDGGIYFGRLKGEEPMAVTEGTLDDAPAITKLSFQSSFSASDTPVILIDVKSSVRKHHYFAYAVNSGSMVKILDVEADNLTVESKRVLLLDNPAGEGAGELAYYEPDHDGRFRFSKIKTDYIDISVNEILSYYGKKVRFTAYADSMQNGGALVTLSKSYNYSTSRWEKNYLLLKGIANLNIYSNYTVIGVFNSYTTITNDYGESVKVPVFQVEKVE